MPELATIDHAADGLQYLRLSNESWQVAKVTATSRNWMFRGQGDSRWGWFQTLPRRQR